jgi:hypothetical protein
VMNVVRETNAQSPFARGPRQVMDEDHRARLLSRLTHTIVTEIDSQSAHSPTIQRSRDFVVRVYPFVDTVWSATNRQSGSVRRQIIP